jgi:hypothetical protein
LHQPGALSACIIIAIRSMLWQLWDAFEAKQNPEAKLAELQAWIDAADPGDPKLADQRFRLEVWTTTLARIRKIEALMAGQQR